MEPENDASQGISSSRGSFSGSMLVFGAVHAAIFGQIYSVVACWFQDILSRIQ